MDAANTSYDLLAHFDQCPGHYFARSTPARGIAWVLRWAAALAVLLIAGCVLTQFAYFLAAERTLARAARAGALEATLPRATRQSIVQAVERRLTAYSIPPGHLRISVQQNGVPVSGMLHPGDGDRLFVEITAPSDAVLPHWLRKATFWNGVSQFAAYAERQMPGRPLPAAPLR